MQRGRGGFGSGDPFGGFGGPFGGFGGFGGPGNLISGLSGGRDPFDDPFFTRPFEGLMAPSMFGPSMFGSQRSFFGEPSMFGSQRSFFGEPSNAGFIEQQAPAPNSRGVTIQELSSDSEEAEEGDAGAMEKKDNPRKHSRSTQGPYVEDPDEDPEEKKSKHIQPRNDFSRAERVPPQGRTYSFHSSTTTYGGVNGAYRTSSTTRRTGGDGVTVEESKEADTTTRRATHMLSRGLRDKGHSYTRKLTGDGRVETMQTLHNLNEDELAGFEEAWKGNARQHLPGWNQGLDMLGNSSDGNGAGSRRDEQPTRGWALPSIEQQPHDPRRLRSQSRPNSFHDQA